MFQNLIIYTNVLLDYKSEKIIIYKYIFNEFRHEDIRKSNNKNKYFINNLF